MHKNTTKLHLNKIRRFCFVCFTVVTESDQQMSPNTSHNYTTPQKYSPPNFPAFFSGIHWDSTVMDLDKYPIILKCGVGTQSNLLKYLQTKKIIGFYCINIHSIAVKSPFI